MHAPQYGMGRLFIPLGRYKILNNPFPAHSTPAAVPQKLALPVSAFLPRHRPVWDTFIPLGRYKILNSRSQAHSTPAVGKPRTAAAPQKLALPVSAFLPRHRPVWDTFIPLGRYKILNSRSQAHSTPAVGKPRTAAAPQKLALPVSAFLPRHRPVWDTFIPLGRYKILNSRSQAHSTGWDGPGPGRGPPPGAAPPGRRWRRFGASSGTGRPS